VAGAVYQEAQEVIAAADPSLLHYGASDDTFWEIGLS
jgi:xanthine/CO dehydrogenase XdhC/CoxF family maturation factor